MNDVIINLPFPLFPITSVSLATGDFAPFYKILIELLQLTQSSIMELQFQLLSV